MKRNRFLLFFLLYNIVAFAQLPKLKDNTPKEVSLADSNGFIRANLDDFKWSSFTRLPVKSDSKTAWMTVLEGHPQNPKDSSHFTMRIKMPAHYPLPPHTHPVDECTTVLKGTMFVGMGSVVDSTKVLKISAGGFYLNPAGTVHYAYTGEEETIVQISTNGPWRVDKVDSMNVHK